MEAKLAAYRRRKLEDRIAEKSLINKLKLALTDKSDKSQGTNADDSSLNQTSNQDVHEQTALNRTCIQSVDHAEHQNLNHFAQPETVTELNSSQTSTKTKWILRMLKALLWLALWGLFIELQFGAVFFAVSLLLFLYFNTRTGAKDNKPSAYSVFNQNCERIQGTLTAEQMQRNMFGVPGLTS